MKKYLPHLKKVLLLMAAVIPMTLFAQEKVKVLVKVVENGKTITDTVYSYDNLDEAEKALTIMDLADKGDLKFKYKATGEPGQHTMYVSSTGETRVIKNGDETVWTTVEKSKEGDSEKDVYYIKKTPEKDGMDAKVLVIRNDGNEDTFDILIDDGMTEKELQNKYMVKVISDGSESGDKMKVYVLDDKDEAIWVEGSDTTRKVEKKVIIINEEGKKVIKEGDCAEKEMMKEKMKQHDEQMKMNEKEMKMKEMQLKEQDMKMKQEMTEKEKQMKEQQMKEKQLKEQQILEQEKKAKEEQAAAEKQKKKKN